MSSARKRRLDTLVTNHAADVHQASPDVLCLEKRVPFENCLGRVAGGEHAEHVLHRKTMTANDRLPAKDGGVSSDSPKQHFFAHERPLGMFGHDFHRSAVTM